MIFAQLSPFLATLRRSAQLLRHYRAHAALRRLDVYRKHLRAVPGSAPLPCLEPGNRLLRGIGSRARAQAALVHYRFEQARFDARYHDAVQGSAGLALWRHDEAGHAFLIRLEGAAPAPGPGELAIALVADGQVLHRLAFTWVDGALAGINTPRLPLVAHNEGRWRAAGAAFDAFCACFPNNSPSFFCFAALQALVQSLGIGQVLGVKCSAHGATPTLAGAATESDYDGFWSVLGGVALPGPAWLVALPFYLKPLADMPSKHRKRAAMRRAWWTAIGASTQQALHGHLLADAAPAAQAQPLGSRTARV